MFLLFIFLNHNNQKSFCLSYPVEEKFKDSNKNNLNAHANIFSFMTLICKIQTKRKFALFIDILKYWAIELQGSLKKEKG